MTQRLALAVLLAVLLSSCYDVRPPPVPTTSRVPTIVGEVTGWADLDLSVRLDSGDIVQVLAQSEVDRPAQLTHEAFTLPSSSTGGSLVLAGTDELGPFYAGTQPATVDGCFELRGSGYIEPDRIHLSSGLVVSFAPKVQRTNDRDHIDPTWLIESDRVCVNRAGQVTSIWQVPLGA